MSSIKLGLWLTLILLTLSGCSRESAPTASTAALLTANPVQASARGIIEIEGGLLSLPVPIAGRVQHIDVQPGTLVKPRQKLVTLSNEDVQLQLKNALQQRLDCTNQQELMNQQIKLLQHRLLIQKKALHQGVGSQSAVDDAEANLLTAELQNQNLAMDLEQRTGQIRLLQAQSNRLVLRAPVAGRIDQIHVQEGSWVQLTDPAIVRMIPHRTLLIHAEVNEAFINRIHAGETAQVHLETLDSSQVFKAHVLYLGATMEHSHLGDNAQMANDFPCYLALDPQEWADAAPTFHIGQTVRVNFL